MGDLSYVIVMMMMKVAHPLALPVCLLLHVDNRDHPISLKCDMNGLSSLK